jgi:hypothetical protein
MPAMAIDPIARFEDSVQRLVEGGLARLFDSQLRAREVAVQITRCMEDQAIRNDSSQRCAPDIYQVRLNPDDHQAIMAAHPEIAAALGKEILGAAVAAGLALNVVPQVAIFADPGITRHHVLVSARHAMHGFDPTESMSGISSPAIMDEPHPDARLLLDGGHVIPIDRPVLNLGRQRDNQIILDEPVISRHHAQIRLRFGRYTLFDLGSAGGTAVNGQRIRESVLLPGDIITIGGKTLIYIEEAPSASEPARGDTGPLNTDLV